MNDAARPAWPVTLDVLQAAFDQSPEGVGICDENGRFVAVNTTLPRLLNRTREEVLGREFLTFVHPGDRAATLAGYFDSLRAAAENGAEPNPVDHAEFRALDRDNNPVWLGVTWTITRPDSGGRRYGVVHLRSLDERKAVEAELAEERRLFRLAYDYAPIGIAVIGLDGRILRGNRALQTMLGYTADELAQLTFPEISEQNDRGPSVAAFEKLIAGDLDVHETIKRYRHKDGHIIHARRVGAVARNERGEAEYLLVHIEDISAEQQATDQLLDLQLRDQLTGLPTRAGLAIQVEPHHLPRSLVVVQLANLPQLRGALGHGGTQRVILEVAARLRLCCGRAALIARVGDGEFAIAVDDPDGWTGATLAGTVAATLDEPIFTEHGSTAISARIGLDTDRTGGSPLDAMLQRAALAGNSSPGAPGWTQFDPTMLVSSARRLALEADLRRAVDDGMLGIVYQPIVEVESGAIVGVEALSRWHHPVLGPVPAEEFISIAENARLIGPLTENVLRTACSDVLRWTADLPHTGHLSVSVNISVHQFPQRSFPERVEQVLAETGLDPHRLVLEITESMAATADDAFIRNARRLRRLGIRLAVDDFGVGYSSLERLARLPITALKLDRSLTGPSADPKVTAALLTGLVTMTADLGVSLVVEGTETAEQLELLRRCRVPRTQGFLFGRPQSAASVEELLATSTTR